MAKQTEINNRSDTEKRIELCETIHHALVDYLGKKYELAIYAYTTKVLNDVDKIKKLPEEEATNDRDK